MKENVAQVSLSLHFQARKENRPLSKLMSLTIFFCLFLLSDSSFSPCISSDTQTVQRKKERTGISTIFRWRHAGGEETATGVNWISILRESHAKIPSLMADPCFCLKTRVHGSDIMVMEGDQKDEGVLKTLDQIEEKALSILKFSGLFDDMIGSLEKKEERLREVEAREKEISLLEESISDRLGVLEEKEMDFDLRKVIEATLMSLVFEKQSEEVATHFEKHEDKLGLLHHSMTKKLEHIVSEFEAKKEEARGISESIHEKLWELEKAEKDLVLLQRAEAEKWNEESESMGESRKKLEAMEKELKGKEDAFEAKQKEEAEKLREETERWNEERKQLEVRKNELSSLEEATKEKSAELKKKEETFELKQKEEAEKLREEIERWNEEMKQLEVRKDELSALEEATKEKSAELKRKEETFELKQKEEAEKWRQETELKSKNLEIKEKALEEMEKELKLKQVNLEERLKQQLANAKTRKRSNLELEPLVPLLVENDSDPCSLNRLAKRHKPQEADSACAPFGNTDPASTHITEANVVRVDISNGDPKSLTCPEAKFNDFNKPTSSFAVDQVWALYDSKDDMPRIYAQIRRIFRWESDLSLQVTLLEHVETRKDEKSIPTTACGRFEYGDTEIKSHLMFAHEMQHIKCGKHVIVNPRKGEKWAVFRDWNTSWSSHSGLHEPPYRFDFVEVITEFDDHIGIEVAYMGKLEGFESVSRRDEQHGLSKITISPGEMQRFSHKVASAEAPTVENQDGSTKDQAIIID
ncbi:unnamed protein product [Thlaspi arvense]|uniref:DUF3444 domain-containing protein n=1 Tax=Thlaspi arvense TaxID=13288 RepID=A0AAU9T186_THLAR|nr:unnamed protein product [Thlaspi arvense]